MLQPTIDNELIQGVQSVNLWSTVRAPAIRSTLPTYVYTTDPVLGEKWSTLEFLPSNFTGLTQPQIDQISADLAAATQVDYAFVFSEVRTLTLPCTSGSFTITPRVSLGPDNFKLGAPQIVPCAGGPIVRITRADTGAVIANNSTFTFPNTDVAQLPITPDVQPVQRRYWDVEPIDASEPGDRARDFRRLAFGLQHRSRRVCHAHRPLHGDFAGHV